eukprot:617360_1
MGFERDSVANRCYILQFVSTFLKPKSTCDFRSMDYYNVPYSQPIIDDGYTSQSAIVTVRQACVFMKPPMHDIVNKNHKQLINAVDGFSINLHQHQQQLKSILQSINQLVTVLQNRPLQSPNHHGLTDELSQFSQTLQKKLELIAQCIDNIHSQEHIESLQDHVVNALNDNNHSLSNKMDQMHKSLSIINTTDLKEQSKFIINSVRNLIQKNQIKHNKKQNAQTNHNEDRMNQNLLQQMNAKLSNIELQTKVFNQDMQQMQTMNRNHDKSESLQWINTEQSIVKKISESLPQIVNHSITNSALQQKLSQIEHAMNTNTEQQLNTKMNTVLEQLQRIQQIREEDDQNNSIILTKLHNKYESIEEQLQHIQQILSTVLSPSFQTIKRDSKQMNDTDLLTTNVFLNRMNAMEQQFESKLSHMAEQQKSFQKCVLEQLNQLMSSNDVRKLKSLDQANGNDWSQNEEQNNLSLWMTVQQIDHNTKELNKQMTVLKEQQIVQYESVTNALFKQNEVFSYATNGVDKNAKSNVKLIRSANLFMPQTQNTRTPQPNRHEDSTSRYSKTIARDVRISNIKYIKPSITSDGDVPNNAEVTECDDLISWSKLNTVEKQQYCNHLMKRLFSRELYQHTVEPRNSFYLDFAKKIIEDWKAKKKWNEDNWELMDEKKLLISKMWSFMLTNWSECVRI